MSVMQTRTKRRTTTAWLERDVVIQARWLEIMQMLEAGATITEVVSLEEMPSLSQLRAYLKSSATAQAEYDAARTIGAETILNEGIELLRDAGEIDGGKEREAAEKSAERYANVGIKFAAAIAPRAFGALVKSNEVVASQPQVILMHYGMPPAVLPSPFCAPSRVP